MCGTLSALHVIHRARQSLQHKLDRARQWSTHVPASRKAFVSDIRTKQAVTIDVDIADGGPKWVLRSICGFACSLQWNYWWDTQ